MRSDFLPYCLPMIGDEEINEVLDTLRAGWLTTGPKVKRFEEEFASYAGARHAIAVSSCTAALHLALAALDVGFGDEVIVPTLTFCATGNVVAHLGARPILVDVDEHFQIPVEDIDRAISPRTRAIIPVHYAGEPCDLMEILDLAERRGIAVIEDAAHAAGAEYQGRKIGTHGLATAFSFYATKNMTTGEGGMLTTDNDRLATRLRGLSLHGMTHGAWNRYAQNGSWYYEVLEAGYKYNMTDIQAALGIHQLRRLDGFIVRRREIARRYTAAFSDLPELQLPRERVGRKHTYHLYAIRLGGGGDPDRETFIREMKRSNIGASVHFIPLHRHPFYSRTYGYRPEDFPMAEWLYKGLVSLPLYPRMTDVDVEDVIHAVREVALSHPRNLSYPMPMAVGGRPPWESYMHSTYYESDNR